MQRNITSLVILAAWFVWPTAGHAEIYKYQDENGKWHYSDQQPKSADTRYSVITRAKGASSTGHSLVIDHVKVAALSNYRDLYLCVGGHVPGKEKLSVFGIKIPIRKYIENADNPRNPKLDQSTKSRGGYEIRLSSQVLNNSCQYDININGHMKLTHVAIKKYPDDKYSVRDFSLLKPEPDRDAVYYIEGHGGFVYVSSDITRKREFYNVSKHKPESEQEHYIFFSIK